MGGRAKAAFKQVDVTRALKGALAAGIPPLACQLRPDGSIYLRFGKTEAEDETNDFDRLLRQ